MTRFKWFFVVSGVLAIAAFAGPLAVYYFDMDLEFDAMFVASWSAIACVALLLIGVALFRVRGLWLAIPTAIALIWPIYVPVMLAKSIDDCRTLHPVRDCLP